MDPIRRGALLALCALILPAGLAGGAPATGGPAGTVEDDAARLARLRREVALLQLETPLARTKQAYAVLDLGGKVLSFRVRGRTMKQYPIAGATLESGPDGSRSLPPQALDRVYKLEDREGREIPVILPGTAEPDGTGGAASGPAGEGTGAAAATGAAMIAPDPPPRYIWRFEDGLSIHVVEAAGPSDAGARRASRVADLARRIGRMWHRLWGGGPRGTTIRLVMDGEKSREAYRSLLPGQSLILLSAAPRPSD